MLKTVAMKPNFALSLSFEGIRLLHRAAGGWRVVGDVALDATDMGAELAVLRRTASSLEPGGVRCKLLVPNAQIKYLTVSTPDMDNTARKVAARAALDGATPYSVDDLAYDISVDGDRTHVAAVARETLTEAEAFAVEHRFHPVSFAAVPADQPYLGEPFFGPTVASKDLLEGGETVEPDGIAVVIIGDVQTAAVPDPEVPPLADPVPDTDEPADKLAEPMVSEQKHNEPEDALPVSGKPVRPEAKDVPVETKVEAQARPEAKAGADSDTSEDGPAPVVEKTGAKADSDSDPDSLDNEADAREDVETSDAISKGAVDDDPKRDHAEKDGPEKDLKREEPKKATTPPKPFVAPPIAPPTKPVTSPVLPALGAASRGASVPPFVPKAPTLPSLEAAQTPAAPATGFASRRTQEATPAAPGRREPSLGVSKSDAAKTAPGVSVSDPSLPDLGGTIKPDSASLTPPKREVATPAKTGFLSRRKAKAAALPRQKIDQTVTVAEPGSEAERMTVFGARRMDVGGKPRFLGLILTAALLVFLAGVAAWASVFLDDGISLSRLFGDRSPRATASIPDAPKPTDEGVRTAALDPSLTEEDGAVLDALRDPVVPLTPVPTQAEAEAKYAATGIWPRAPRVPPEPAALIDIEDLYMTSIDPVSTSSDAVALASPEQFLTDVAFGSVTSPVAAGTQFTFDARGLVVPTAQGALSPDGFTVYSGRPEVVPTAFPDRSGTEPTTPVAENPLAELRPRTRPGDLIETSERAQLDGLTRSELAGLRPQLRPQSVQQLAAAAQTPAPESPTVDTSAAVAAALATAVPAPTPPIENATRFAVRASLRPDTRPTNFARIVQRAQRAPPAQETQVASAASVAPRVVTPSIPSKTSVARQATVKNAINLHKVNLIGVYGKPSSRRALVRLGNGRYKKVVVGDRIDGGRVSAIGNSELQYTKRGRSFVLRMPKG